MFIIYYFCSPIFIGSRLNYDFNHPCQDMYAKYIPMPPLEPPAEAKDFYYVAPEAEKDLNMPKDTAAKKWEKAKILTILKKYVLLIVNNKIENVFNIYNYTILILRDFVIFICFRIIIAIQHRIKK